MADVKSGAEDCQTGEMPRQAVILAAGRSAKLSPYTDEVPTALITIAEKPMVAHGIATLRSFGVERFVICRGWQGEAFDDCMEELGEGVVLVDCPDYNETGMLETLRLAMDKLDEGGFYVVYGDIIFRSSVARQLAEAPGVVSIVVNAASPGSQSKGLQDVEIVNTSGEGASRVVRRIGKGRCARPSEVVGEFGGFVKFTSAGRKLALDIVSRLYPQPGGAKFAPPPRQWWLEPVAKASLCDLLQLLADDGAVIAPAMIFGGWHEVNTPQDLTRVWGDTAMFLSEADTKKQVSAMGACLLSEANDLKRPLPIVAKELNVGLSKLESLLKGDLELGDALDVLRKMSEVYPVPLNDLWLDADDTVEGVRMCKWSDSKASARILDRKDKSGKKSPYYEYRDAAMSRCSQFRPEWIKELRVVTSEDPLDPDVVLNNGHLMMQSTMFIGPVDFYWKDRYGVVQRRAMNSGDSNFISPFVPHSFTVRDKDKEGVIIAVTYGGRVRRAFTEFARLGSEKVMPLAGDKRDPELLRRSIFKRNLEADCMSAELLASKVASKISGPRVTELLSGKEATFEELVVMAKALCVQPSDLLASELTVEEEVVVTRTEESQEDARRTGTYVIAPLARSPHQPDLKTFDIEVLDTAVPGEMLSCGLHCFVYHFGTEPVELTWTSGRARHMLIEPGDSVYIAPLVQHSFSVAAQGSPRGFERQASGNGDTACCKGRRLFLVRIPGHLTGETLAEFATFSANGRDRVGAETKQWYG